MLEELKERRAEIIKRAEEYKIRRTELNSEASKWSELRDELNARIKVATEKAKTFKLQREEYEELIVSKKAKRDELNKKMSSCYLAVKKRRKKSDMQSIQSFERLKDRIAELELKQQVEVIGRAEERKLVARITELRRELDRLEKKLWKDVKLAESMRNAEKYRKEADKYHEEVINLVKLSRECHDKMVDHFKEADRIRKKADSAHLLFLEAQKEADESHKRYIRYIRDVRDFDRVISGLQRKIWDDWGFRERIEAKKKAKGIYERFKEGEKLSTEDLMQMQRFELGLK